MPWFKVDDKFHSSEEVMSIPMVERAAAIGLWTLAGAWSADQLKDGYVPGTHLETWGGTVELANVLVRAKLWTRVASRGFQFRNWDKWQVTRADVDESRTTWREKKAAERARKAVKTGDGLAPVPSDMSGSPAPVPSIPVPVPVPTQPLKETAVPRKRGTRIPDPFIVTGDMRAWAASKEPTVDVNRSTEKFVNYWRAKTRDATKLDWLATWQNWLMTDADRQPTAKSTPTQKAQRTMALASDLVPKELE